MEMKRVLIIDADKYARVKLSLLLKECGCDVEAVETVSEAVEKVREKDFGCVIVDVQARNGHGYEGIPVIRAICSDIEVIATTSENWRGLEAKTREKGIFYYYIKSFEPEELVAAVENAFKKYERKQHG